MNALIGQSAGLITKDTASPGQPTTADRLLDSFDQWAALGMPCGANFQVEIERQRTCLQPSEKHAWIEDREDQTFLWKLQS
jgi:hypothetical protein